MLNGQTLKINEREKFEASKDIEKRKITPIFYISIISVTDLLDIMNHVCNGLIQ